MAEEEEAAAEEEAMEAEEDSWLQQDPDCSHHTDEPQTLTSS
jgi:hypothetical protein